MSAVTVDLARLDTHTSRTEAAARQTTASTPPGYWEIRRELSKIHQELSRARDQVATFTIESPEDRKKAHDLATGLGQIAHRLEELVPEIEALTPPLPPLVGQLLEDAICQAEDSAETLALSASEEFADLADRTLAEVHSGA